MTHVRPLFLALGVSSACFFALNANAATTYCMQNSPTDGYANLRAAPKDTAPKVGKLAGVTKLPRVGDATGAGCATAWAKLKLASGRIVWACTGVLKCGTKAQLNGSSDGAAGGGASFTEVVSMAKVRLNVPYYYQYANANDPGGSCNITSAAMAIRYGGGRASPDGIYKDSRGLRHGTTGTVDNGEALALIGRQYGLKDSKLMSGVDAKTVKKWLRRRVPFILQGYFSNTGRGHILVITGYDATGWYINDPAGKWSGTPGPGAYSGHDGPQAGKSVHYSYRQVDKNSLTGANNFTGAILH